jgi:hypothetical protein
MTLARFWSTIKLLHFSQPAGDRALYKAVRGRRIASVLEVHVGRGQRSRQLVEWLHRQSELPSIRYAAIDAFDLGGADHQTLKQFHATLGKLGAKPLPVPHTGNLAVALKRVVHTIGSVDLLILDCPPEEYLEPSAATVLPRLVHPQTIVMGQCAETSGLWPVKLEPATDSQSAAA